MASENIKERKIYRVLIDELNRVWERIYFLTNARSVDADDGENLETKVGAIKGITTSTTVTENGWAADATIVSRNLIGINTEISELKKSVADGKALIASAITNKGINTPADATFTTMASKINSIQTSYKGNMEQLGYKVVQYEINSPKSGGEFEGSGSLTLDIPITKQYSVIIFITQNDRGVIGNNYGNINISLIGASYDKIYSYGAGNVMLIGAIQPLKEGEHIQFNINYHQSTDEWPNPTGYGRLTVWGLA